MLPSAISESPRTTHVRKGSLSTYLPSRAMPTPIGRPCPSEPVATSTHFRVCGFGWPSRRLPNLRRVSSSASSMAPAALYIEYSTGHAWPLLKIRWSLLGFLGLFQSYLRYFALCSVFCSAAVFVVVGCLVLAAV